MMHGQAFMGYVIFLQCRFGKQKSERIYTQKFSGSSEKKKKYFLNALHTKSMFYRKTFQLNEASIKAKQSFDYIKISCNHNVTKKADRPKKDLTAFSYIFAPNVCTK